MRTETSAAPLVILRFGFGLMMLLSIVRFWAYGWIDKLYLQPTFFFSYRYFEWVRPLGGWTYVLFAVVAAAAACIMVGYRHRAATLVFFLGFTYIELMDKTTYLNHYYFVSLLALLLFFLPVPGGLAAARGLRVDRKYVRALQLFVAVVYFYAGLAKLNSDWLLHAQPLAIWLPARYDVPLLGDLLQQRWVHFAFAWGGMLYDLAIPFLLWYRRTRVVAFALVVVFHVLTRVLFPIGMFPYIMIVSALVFFDPAVHDRLLEFLSRLTGGARPTNAAGRTAQSDWRLLPVAALLLFHLVFPFRHLLQTGELFWTENGYRFSWRVMLMEKAGLATFRVEDAAGDRRAVVDNREFLTVFQEKQMSAQPDFILEFGHYLADHYRALGWREPRVYVDSYVALNGRLSQRYVDPEVDLTRVPRGTPPSRYLRPFQDTIYGF